MLIAATADSELPIMALRFMPEFIVRLPFCWRAHDCCLVLDRPRCRQGVATPILEEVMDAEMKAQFESLIPRRKMGRPEEIASVALFLASDDSSYVNGMELVVDGGTTVI
jgi:hypothetical protein